MPTGSVRRRTKDRRGKKLRIIDREGLEVAVCRYSTWSVLFVITARTRSVIERRQEYRPRIDQTKVARLAHRLLATTRKDWFYAPREPAAGNRITGYTALV